MRDIRLPETSDKSIDISAIDTNTEGIILVYKGNKPIGFIGYDDDNNEWVYLDDITINCSYKRDENLLALLRNVIASNYADSFKLVDFK
jgi:hypothetical protein